MLAPVKLLVTFNTIQQFIYLRLVYINFNKKFNILPNAQYSRGANSANYPHNLVQPLSLQTHGISYVRECPPLFTGGDFLATQSEQGRIITSGMVRVNSATMQGFQRTSFEVITTTYSNFFCYEMLSMCRFATRTSSCRCSQTGASSIWQPRPMRDRVRCLGQHR